MVGVEASVEAEVVVDTLPVAVDTAVVSGEVGGVDMLLTRLTRYGSSLEDVSGLGYHD